MKKIFLLFILFSICSWVGLAFASNEGPPLEIAVQDEDQQNPDIVALPDKNVWFVVWEDWREADVSNGSGADIWGQFVNADGTLCGEPFLITTDPDNPANGKKKNQTNPSVTYAQDLNRLFVVWQDAEAKGREHLVYQETLNYTINYTDDDDAKCEYEYDDDYSLLHPNKELNYIAVDGPELKCTCPSNKDGTELVCTYPFETNEMEVVCTADEVVYPDDDNNDDNIEKIFKEVKCRYVWVMKEKEVPTYLSGRGILVANDPCSDSNYLEKEIIFPQITRLDYNLNGYKNDFDQMPKVLGRAQPDVTYDPIKNEFWLAWVEYREFTKRVAAYGFECSYEKSGYSFGDTSFVGYAAINAKDPDGDGRLEFVEDHSPDVLHTEQYDTAENIRMFSRSIGCDEDIITYDFFDQVNNPSISADAVTGNILLTWEGVKRTATLTFKDDPDHRGCFVCGEASASSEVSFSSAPVQIHGIFIKNIPITNFPSLAVSNMVGDAYDPSVAIDPVTGKFLVAFEALPTGSLNTKIYGQLIYSGGGLYNRNFIVSFQDTDGDGINDPRIEKSRQTNPYVGYDYTNQRFFVAWQDARNSSVSLENLDIYGQYVDAEGSLRGSNHLISVSSDGRSAQGNQYSPAIAFNIANHLFLGVWKDARNYDSTKSDIYGQRFTIGQPQLTILNPETQLPLSPPLLDFGSLETGEERILQFQIKNTGDKALNIRKLSLLESPFSYVALPQSLLNGEGMTLLPSAGVLITVRFSPTAQNSYHEELTIESDAGTLIVNLQGIGIIRPPASSSVTAEPPSVDFGSVAIGESAYETITIRNTGNTIIQFLTPDAPKAPFELINEDLSSVSLNPGETKSVTLKFSPTSSGEHRARLVLLFSNANPLIVPLSGYGIETSGSPNISLSSSRLDFSSILVGESSAMHLTVTNTGNGSTELIHTTLNGNGFKIISPDLSTLEHKELKPGQKIHLIIEFTPEDAGEYNASLQLFFTHTESPLTVSLFGIGIETSGPPNITVSSSRLDFSSILVGESSAMHLTVTNTGNGSTELIRTTLNGNGFKIISPDLSTLEHKELKPGQKIHLIIEFTPEDAGEYNASLQLFFTHTESPLTVSLFGIGIETSGPPNITLSSSDLIFPDTPVGSTSAKHLTISNTGTGNAVLLYSTLIGSGFATAGQKLSNLEIKAGETIHSIIEFSPKEVSDYTGTLQLFFAHQITPIEIALNGKGISEQEYQNNQGQGDEGDGQVEATSDKWADPRTMKPDVVVWKQDDGSVHWSFDPNDLDNVKADRYVVLVTPWIDPWTGSLQIYSKNASGHFVPGLVPEAAGWSMRSYTYSVPSLEALVPNELKGPGQYYLFFGVISPNKLYAAYDWITWIW